MAAQGSDDESSGDELPAMLAAPPQDFVKALMGSLKGTVGAAQRLPGEAEFEYQASLVASTGTLDACSSKLVSIIQRSAAAWGVGLQLRPGSDPDDAFETLVDVTDSIFEEVDDCAPHTPLLPATQPKALRLADQPPHRC